MYKLIRKTNHFMIKRKPEVLISSNGLSPKNYSAATMKIKAKVTKVKTMTQLKTHQMIKRMMLGLIDNISHDDEEELCRRPGACAGLLGPTGQNSHVEDIAMMKCSICHEYTEKSQIREHLREHFSGSASSHFCDKCGKSFQTSHLLKYHSLSHDDPKFPCDSCKYKALTKGALKVHIKAVHTRESVQRCDVCFEGFAVQRSLIRHMMKKHGREHKLKCDKCNRIFLTEQRFSLHTADNCKEEILNKKEKNACDICSYKAKEASHLRSHKAAVHDKVTHFCDTCNYKSTWKQNVDDHIKHTHRNIVKVTHPCGLCDYSTTKFGNLKIHAEAVHLKKREECGLCGHTTSGKSNMRKHMIKAHNRTKNGA